MDEATKARFDSVDACLSEDLARIARNDIRLNQMDGAFSAHIERHEERFNALAMAIEHTVKASLDILSRVEALEAERMAPEASTTPTPPAAVPSDEELWEVQLAAWRQVYPSAEGELWSPYISGQTARHRRHFEASAAGHRALYNYGYERGFFDGRSKEALAVVRAEAERQAAPKPEPTHPQYFSSNHAIAGEIWGMLPDAPEPSQAPAGDGGLVDTIFHIIGNEPIIGRPCPAVSAVILAVAKWLRSRGNHYAATELEREAQR